MANPPAGDNTPTSSPPLAKQAGVGNATAGRKDSSGDQKNIDKHLHDDPASVSDIILITDTEMKITSVSPGVEAILGYKPEELVKRAIVQPGLFSASSMELMAKNLSGVLAGATTRNQIYEFVAKDGRVTIVEATSIPLVENSEITGVITIARDIKEQWSHPEDTHHAIIETIPDGYFEIDLSGKYTFVNDVICAHLQRTRDELIGRDNRDFQTPEDAKLAFRLFQNVYKTGIPERSVEIDVLSKNGTSGTYELSISLIRDAQGKPAGFRGISRDITGRKRMEEDLIKSEEEYLTIVENAQEGIFQTSPREQSLSMNRALAEMLGYSSPEEATGELINNFQDAFVDPEAYREVMENLGQHGSIKSYEVEFYRRDKSRIWANMSITAVKDQAGSLLYYHGIVEDVTPKKKLEWERQKSIESLRRSLGATIKAVSAITEAKDPYTAGHQRRVADLARTIATEMKLPPDQIDGIRLASMIHDLGKIVIPSEILTKPTKLTDLEKEIIKTHAEAGYEILKDIEFPWPIARMVHEHHERIDGSGYPRGLKGDEILLESKIIAVADVVEAISSNRPYRPALGIGVALEEIENKKGIFYDRTVSEICLKLFHEKRYTMPE